MHFHNVLSNIYAQYKFNRPNSLVNNLFKSQLSKGKLAPNLFLLFGQTTNNHQTLTVTHQTSI